jgi:hypothetical protein
VSRREPDESRRGALPRPLREILDPALERLATSDQARAFGAWTRASGAPLSSAARPSAFFNGVLTIECASSVWANELTYMSVEILARMDRVSPGQPVKRLRFVVARARRPDEVDDGASDSAGDPPARLSGDALEGARTAARGVRDERLRAAIEAALEASSGQP